LPRRRGEWAGADRFREGMIEPNGIDWAMNLHGRGREAPAGSGFFPKRAYLTLRPMTGL
jgi:hypothetical protein